MTVRIEADIKWSEGDSSVGIWAGWDLEETMVTVYFLDLMLVIGFEPIDHLEVCKWPVRQIDVTRRTGSRRNRVGAEEPTYANFGAIDPARFWESSQGKGPRDAQLGDFPDEIVNAVEVEWKTYNDLMRKADEEIDKMLDEEPIS